MREPVGCFLYPAKGEWPCPHPCHKAWAMGVCKYIKETPKGVGRMKEDIPDGCDFIIMESLYSLPYAVRYKRMHPWCKVISIIADTSFLPQRLTVLRWAYYWYAGLSGVDAFICESNRIAKDCYNYMNNGSFMRPIYLMRPFMAVEHKVKPGKKFGKGMLFVGGRQKEKRMDAAINAMEYLPGDFYLGLIGSCCEYLPKLMATHDGFIRVLSLGRVPSLKKYFDDATYYIHPADFDSCPTAVWEAMYAGLIPIVTADVGNSEVFDGVLKRLVLDDNHPKTIAAKVLEIDALSLNTKKAIRRECIRVASVYMKSKSVSEFKALFNKIWVGMDG